MLFVNGYCLSIRQPDSAPGVVAEAALQSQLVLTLVSDITPRRFKQAAVVLMEW